MKTELLPCPFCGNKVFWLRLSWSNDLELNDNEEGYWIRCFSCGCHGPWMPTEKGAKLEWNKRVTK